MRKILKLTRKRKIITAIVIAVILIIVIASVVSRPNPAGMNAQGLAYTSLTKTDLIDKVSVSGTIESKTSENIFTTLPYPVQTIDVELGDVVEAGDVLARLDTSTLSKDVEQARYNANATTTTTKTQYENAKTTYESSKNLYESGAISKSEFQAAENSFKIAQSNYNNRSASSALSKLEKQLQDAVIKAPINGTVTMVNAVEGSPASGVLFVVEDVDQLVIRTAIKEFDVGNVKPGQPVSIKTDGTGDISFQGIVDSISPAAKKSAAGQTVSSSDVEFETVVSLVDKNPALKIGMNARLSITISEKKNVYSVPFEAVIQNEDGSNSVMIAVSQGDGYVAEAVPVETGMETDFIVEVSGAGLTEGLLVLSNPGELKPGDPLKLNKEPAGK